MPSLPVHVNRSVNQFSRLIFWSRKSKGEKQSWGKISVATTTTRSEDEEMRPSVSSKRLLMVTFGILITFATVLSYRYHCEVYLKHFSKRNSVEN